jgi:ectoine hydroxylase-related dioxygenase (phytanoyl-CoA dioxygenase family)
MSTTNGKTYFKDKDPVDCKENRIVIFDSKLYHSSSTSTDSNQRIVINFNYHE